MSRKHWAGVLFWLFVIFILGIAALFSLNLTLLTLTWVLFLPLFFLLVRRVQPKRILLAASFLVLLGAFSAQVLMVTAQFRPGASLVDADLRYADLSGRDLQGADLSGADLTGATLSGANLRQAKLSNANLEGADLRRADLTGAVLDGLTLENTDLSDSMGITDDILANSLSVSIDELPGVLSQRNIRLQSRDDIIESLKDVRLGEAAVGAGPYAPNGDFHPVVLLDGNGEFHSWSDDMGGWEAMALRFAELVLFVDEQERVLMQTCQYQLGGTWTRYEYEMKVDLFSAKTGELVASVTVVGEPPDPCPEIKETGHGESIGERVVIEDLQLWLAEFVNPPSYQK